MTRAIEIIALPEPVAYGEMLARQQARRAEVEAGRAPNTLFLLEHSAVITQGRNAQPQHVLAEDAHLESLGVERVAADRGGDVTYHGPGQLVAYPILRLGEWRCSISWYLRTLEQVLIDLLAEYGIKSWREDGLTGVWTARGKIAAIGVGVHAWTTFHGIALNVNTNMEHFELIVPCGIHDRPVVSLHQLLDAPPGMAEVREKFTQVFMRHFGGEGVEE